MSDAYAADPSAVVSSCVTGEVVAASPSTSASPYVSPVRKGAGRAPLVVPPSLLLDRGRVRILARTKNGAAVSDAEAGMLEDADHTATGGGACSRASGILGTGSFARVVRGELIPAPPLPGAGSTPAAATRVAVKILDRAKAEASAFMNLQLELDTCAEMDHPCLINTLGVVEIPPATGPSSSTGASATAPTANGGGLAASPGGNPLIAGSNGYVWIIMELADKGELLQYMQRYGLEDMPEVAPMFVGEAVLALEYMASKGLVHRDVKPDNLLLTSQYHVKLGDFGTVCKAGTPEAGIFRGTTAYAAPEVLRPGGTATPETDLWALGCVVYELFVGRPPFRGDNDYLMRQEVLQGVVSFPPYFPEAARSLVVALLRPDPAARLGSAAMGGFDALKAHPFFAKVNWETLLRTSHHTTLNADYDREVEPLLLPDERIIFAGPIKKERYLSFSTKQRLLVLTTFPRLFYLEPGTFTIKGQVPWSGEVCASVLNAAQFDVHTGEGQRVYHFICERERASTWASRINAAAKEAQIAAKKSKMRGMSRGG